MTRYGYHCNYGFKLKKNLIATKIDRGDISMYKELLIKQVAQEKQRICKHGNGGAFICGQCCLCEYKK